MKTKELVKRHFFCAISVVVLFLVYALPAASIVYNLRIAETTRREKSRIAEHDTRESYWGFTVTLADQLRKFNNFDIHQNISSTLATFFYSGKSFYVRADSAVGHLVTKGLGAYFAATQLDDLVFTGGYNCMSGERLQLTLSSLFGVPLHKDMSFAIPLQFGIGHVSLGVQADGSFVYNKNSNRIVMGAARLIYFFSRSVKVIIGDIEEHFSYEPGYYADLFIAHQNIWGRHRFEFGYNPTFSFGAAVQPPIAELKFGFIRSSFYSSYQCLFAPKNAHIAGALITGISYGFDHDKRNSLSYHHLISFWLSGSIAF